MTELKRFTLEEISIFQLRCSSVGQKEELRLQKHCNMDGLQIEIGTRLSQSEVVILFQNYTFDVIHSITLVQM